MKQLFDPVMYNLYLFNGLQTFSGIQIQAGSCYVTSWTNVAMINKVKVQSQFQINNNVLKLKIGFNKQLIILLFVIPNKSKCFH